MYQGGSERTSEGWKRIGLYADEEDPTTGPFSEVDLFQDTGELGLDCLVSSGEAGEAASDEQHYFATHEESFHDVIYAFWVLGLS
jgi:hypothetical protein